MADFNGEDPNGDWTITIVDGALDLTTGIFNSWELRFTSAAAIPDNSPAGASVTLSIPNSNIDDIVDLDVAVNIDHPNVAELEIQLDGPGGISIDLLAAGGASGANLIARFDDDSALNGFCDGFGTNIVASGLLADFDGEALAGDWTLTVVDTVAGNTGSLSSFDLLVNPATCDPVTALVCDADCATQIVALSWTLPTVSLGGIEVRRDGMTIANLPGNELFYNDDTATPGVQHLYEVISDCDPGRARATCTATLNQYNGEKDVIFALEDPDQVDSAAALAAGLQNAGADLLVVNTLDFPCLDPTVVERVWLLCGTFPQNYTLTQLDGNTLVAWHNAGVNLYIEGGDIWGIDPQTNLQTVDGVENFANGNTFDGDDTLDLLTGLDSGVGFDLSGLSDLYNQASPNSDDNDQIRPCNVFPDVGGDQAGAIWQGPGYIVGVYYASSLGDVISQSWEFGGWNGDQGFLGCGVLR